MNKLLIPNPSRGIDFAWEIFEFLLGTAVIKGGLHETLQNMLRTYGDNYIVYGCTVVGSSVSAGLIILDGELLTVDAHTKTNDYFVKVISNDTTWDIKDLDGNSQFILKKYRATLTAASGNLHYNGNGLGDLILPKAGINYASVPIGVWNMNGTAYVEINHGLSAINIAAMLFVQAKVRDDTGANWYILGSHGNIATNPGISYFDNIKIRLDRQTGGAFDNTNFDSTSFSRGYVNFIYGV